MAVTKARPGFGATFMLGNAGSPEVFTALSDVVGIPSIGSAQRIVEATHMLSPEGWSEHIATGVKDGNSFTLPLNFVADEAAQISLYKTRATDGSVHNYRVSFTDAGDSTLTFPAIITNVEITHEIDSKADATITFQPVGEFVYA